MHFLKKTHQRDPDIYRHHLGRFFLIRLVPVGLIEVMVGERRIDPLVHAEMVKRMGLDLPLYEQYGVYLGKLCHGDFGLSLVSREPVAKTLRR